MGDLSHQEFERWMQMLRADIREVHDRLDVLNGRTRTTEQKIAVLEDRSDTSRTTAAGWGAGVSGVIVGVVETIRWLTTK